MSNDILDALLNGGDVDPAALAARLRKQEQLGTLATLTGVEGLQKLGPQMITQAGQGAQDYATLRDRTNNQMLQRALQAQGQQLADRQHADALAETASRDRQTAADRAADRQNRLDIASMRNQDKEDEKNKARQDKLDAAYGKQQGSISSMADSMDALNMAADKLYNHPGLNSITGLIGGHTWNLTDSARDAQALLDNIKAKVTIGAMLALKAASPTGSTGFGQLSNVEGEKLQNSISSLDKAQSYDAIRENLKTIMKYTQLAKQRGLQTLARMPHSPELDGVVPPAAPAGAAPPAAPNGGKTVVRLGTQNGQRVALYSDGTIGPAP